MPRRMKRQQKKAVLAEGSRRLSLPRLPAWRAQAVSRSRTAVLSGAFLPVKISRGSTPATPVAYRRFATHAVVAGASRFRSPSFLVRLPHSSGLGALSHRSHKLPGTAKTLAFVSPQAMLSRARDVRGSEIRKHRSVRRRCV